METELDLLDDFDPEAFDLEEIEPDVIRPDIDTDERVLSSGEVDYSTRRSGDFILSGPLPGGWGPGRRFNSRRAAMVWGITKYGAERISPTPEVTGRWAYMVRAKNAR